MILKSKTLKQTFSTRMFLNFQNQTSSMFKYSFRIIPKFKSIQEIRSILFYPKFNKKIYYNFCLGFSNKQQGKLTNLIQVASNLEALKKIFHKKKAELNIISRTALLKKITVRPFDYDEEFIKQVVQNIQANWNEYQLPESQNARAIANTICYMSRNLGRHQLDNKFKEINYYELFKHTNDKQFVMVVTGLLKLQLLDKINEQQIAADQQNKKKIRFDIEELIRAIAKPTFHPGLIVSLWRNMIKFNKSSRSLNNFFAEMLKTKHLKKYLRDYAYFVYCYTNTLNDIDIDLSFTLLAYPKQIQILKTNRLQAHEFSLLCENLVQVQKLKGIYLDQKLIQLLRKNYISIITENNIPLRNISNCLNNFMLLAKFQQNMIYQTFSSYTRILSSQIKNNDSNDNKKKKSLVDPISFVFLFDKLLVLHEEKFSYFDKLMEITFVYIYKIAKNGELKKYPELQFIRLMKTITQTKKKVYSNDNYENLRMNEQLQQLLFKEITSRQFQPKHFSYLISYVSTLQMRSKQFCLYALKNIQKMDKTSQKSFQLDVRLKQKCIVNKFCHRCLDCFNQSQTVKHD